MNSSASLVHSHVALELEDFDELLDLLDEDELDDLLELDDVRELDELDDFVELLDAALEEALGEGELLVCPLELPHWERANKQMTTTASATIAANMIVFLDGPLDGAGFPTSWPQFWQNLALSGNSLPHFTQNMAPPSHG